MSKREMDLTGAALRERAFGPELIYVCACKNDPDCPRREAVLQSWITLRDAACVEQRERDAKIAEMARIETMGTDTSLDVVRACRQDIAAAIRAQEASRE